MAEQATENDFEVEVDEPDESALATEDDAPLDSIYQEKAQRLLTAPLLESWSGPVDGESVSRPFVAMANVGLFFNPTSRRSYLTCCRASTSRSLHRSPRRRRLAARLRAAGVDPDEV